MVVGVAGTMPVHGMGTTRFLMKHNGDEFILAIHNCLLCHGETTFNLLSVSQMLRSTDNSIIFKAGESKIQLKHNNKEQSIDLTEEKGLYGISMQPLSINDKRNAYLARFDITPEHDPKLFNEVSSDERLETMMMKSPSVLRFFGWVRKQ